MFYHDDVYPNMMNVDPNARLIIGGVNASPCGILWLQEFVSAYEGSFGEVPRAGWHFHLYPEVVPETWDGSSSLVGCDTWNLDTPTPPPTPTDGHGYWWGRPERLALEHWLNDARNIKSFIYTYGDPVNDEVWVTEMGCLIPDCASRSEFLYEYVRDVTGWLSSEEGRFIDRYAWYIDWDNASWPYTKLYDFTPTPTPTPTPLFGGTGSSSTPTPTPLWNRSTLGNYYAQVRPAAAGPLPILSHSVYWSLIMKTEP